MMSIASDAGSSRLTAVQSEVRFAATALVIAWRRASPEAAAFGGLYERYGGMTWSAVVNHVFRAGKISCRHERHIALDIEVAFKRLELNDPTNACWRRFADVLMEFWCTQSRTFNKDDKYLMGMLISQRRLTALHDSKLARVEPLRVLPEWEALYDNMVSAIRAMRSGGY